MNYYKRFSSLLALLIFFVITPALAQVPSIPFKKNIVRIAGRTIAPKEQPVYGFVTGKSEEELYFIQIIPKEVKDVENNVKVMFSDLDFTSKKKALQYQAQLVSSSIGKLRIGDYKIALYSIKLKREIQNTYYSGLVKEVNDQYGISLDFTDSQENINIIKHAMQITMFKDRTKSNSPIFFAIPKEGERFSYNGMPITDSRGVLKAIVASGFMEKKEDKKDFTALSIMDIKNQLEGFGSSVNSPCRYFNLLREGTNLTPCDSSALARKVSVEQELAYQRKLEKLSNAARRELLADNNSPFAISIGAGGYISTPNIGEDMGMSDLNHSFNFNLHFSPDSGSFRITAMPRWVSSKVSPSENFSYANASNFKWKGNKYTSIEVPIIVEIPTRTYSGGTYFGFGYSYGQYLKNEFKYSISEIEESEEVIANPKHIHKAWLTFGVDYKKIRLNLYGNYQFSPSVRTGYEIITGANRIKPFENVKKGILSFGVELSYRLWGHWQNGSRF